MDFGEIIRGRHISQVSVPLLSDENTQREINNTVLEAIQNRTEVYNLEQKALRIHDEKVI